MVLSVAHLGPQGTHTETAAIAYINQLEAQRGQQALLNPYPNIAQTLQALAQGLVDLAVVPVENSVEGGVSMTLDTLWQLDRLQIQHALVLPIFHALICCTDSLATISTVYSHPQALAQCHKWLLHCLPQAQLVPTNATTEALQYLEQDNTKAAIASPRAAQLYNLPVVACPINDYPDNYTRFWVLGLQPSNKGSHTSVAFSVPANVPSALVKPLSCFANRGINLSRIESRPTKRSLGEYLFFIDLEVNAREASVQSALEELATCTETLKIFGSYSMNEVSVADLCNKSNLDILQPQECTNLTSVLLLNL
jgi:prephenate dehydratase